MRGFTSWNKMVAPCIEKDIAHCFSQTILTSTFEEIGDDVFALLVDKSINVSKKTNGSGFAICYMWDY